MADDLDTTPDPARIMQIGMGFWASKALLSAVELRLFSILGDGLTRSQVAERLSLGARHVDDFLDALVSLELLERDGSGEGAVYRNTAETALFLDQASPAYLGGILEMANDRLYPFWADLTEALRSGQPQNEIKHTGSPVFDELYADPARLEQFMSAMAGISAGPFMALADAFDFSRYETVVDAGGATGLLSIILAQRHPHLRLTSLDLPVVQPIAERAIKEAGVEDRVTAASGDFFAEPLPKADVVTMGLILHDWNEDKKRQLIASAFDALPDGGAFIAVENLIDDERRVNTFGLLMSLNMLIEFGDAFDFTGADFSRWCTEAGFSSVEVLPLAGPTSAAVAYK